MTGVTRVHAHFQRITYHIYSPILKRKQVTNILKDIYEKKRGGGTSNVKTVRGVIQGCCLSPILFDLYSECLTTEALEGFGDFEMGGQIINNVKYADDLVLLAKEEMVLQDTIDKLIEIGRCHGMAMNMGKNRTKIMRIPNNHFL
jgi:hypothetical protein